MWIEELFIDGERVQIDTKYVPMEYLSKELKETGKRWLVEYNNFPMRPLKWLSPKEKLAEYQGI